MFNSELANKIDELIKDKFPIIYEYDFDGIVLLCSGVIRSLMMDDYINDLDFVILTQNQCKILDFIKKYKLEYEMNVLGGYKLLFNCLKIDIFSVNDLLEATVYDTDMLFYDINIHQFLICGAIRAFENRTITHVNDGTNINYANNSREKKIIKFMKYITCSNKSIRVKKNKILWLYKTFVYKAKLLFNKLRNSNLLKCLRFFNSCKKEFIIILILGVILSLLSFTLPSVIGLMLSNLLNINYKKILLLILAFFLIKLIILIVQFIFTKLYLIINKNMINNIRKEITDCVLNFDMTNFVSNNSGTFIEKLKNDPRDITRNFNSIKDILVRGIGNFGLLLYILFLDWRIGIILLVFMVIIISIMIKGTKIRKQYITEYYDNQEKYSSVLGEMVNGVSDIKNLDLKDNYMKKTIFSFKKVSEKEFEGNYYQRFYNKIASFVELIAIVIVFLVGLYLVKKNLLAKSSLIIIFMYNSTLFSFMEKIGLLMSLITDLNVSCDRVFSLLDGNLYYNEIFGNKYNKKCKGIIEFKDVKFKYNYKDKWILNDCNFIVNSNECIAIVGKSGEGKTTILNLISRLYSVDSGKITVDGVDINEYSEKFIRDNISVISQNPYLFDMSIKENLRLVKEDITDKEIVNVCKLVCLGEFIETLPDKYDTVIGEGGVKLSGGQKQRLGIARALIKNTKIILLDEITSALDNETGAVIKKVINNIKKNHTVIIVTHELSMIKDADRILVLDNRKISGDGKHKDLLKNNEVYKKLYKIK